MSFRFRDVYDHLVRLSDDALIFQDRITGILDAHLSNVSNRLNEVMKVLTVVTTIVMPLHGARRALRHERAAARHLGRERPRAFWWILGFALAIVLVMLAFLREKKRWIFVGRIHRCRRTSPTRSPRARWSNVLPRS